MEEAENSVKKVIDLNGEYRFKIDSKGRMSLPAKFRKVMGKDLVVARDIQFDCLRVFEQEDYNEWVAQVLTEKLGEFKQTDKRHVSMRRWLKRRAEAVEIDATNRILLPAGQRAAVGITKDVVIVGNTGYFEIWDAQRFDELDAEYDFDSDFI